MQPQQLKSVAPDCSSASERQKQRATTARIQGYWDPGIQRAQKPSQTKQNETLSQQL